MNKSILKYTLINAVQHEGRANVNAVLGKLIAEDPTLKSKIKEIIPQITKIVDDVNLWGLEKQERQIKQLGITIGSKPEVRELPALPNAVLGQVVMRLAPYPSGPLHIGNARMVLLNDEYVKRYDGELLLVLDDTIGSREKYVISEAYDLIIDGLRWLGVTYKKPVYKSDRLELFYEYAKIMLEKNFAYVCTCSQEQLRNNRAQGTACECRTRSVEENIRRWEDMLAGKYREGEAIVRLKTDMKHPDPAFRDRVLLRISDREHPRVGNKYRVWPMLEFSWAIDDHQLGVTHILRGKDLIMEDRMEQFIWKQMNWKAPEILHYGMLRIKEATLSKSRSRMAIEEGELMGWEDPRTWSLQSLRRRGIHPKAVRNFILKMGLSVNDVTLPAEILYAENRRLIDSVSNRYFGVMNPIRILINNAPPISRVKAHRHPDFPDKGFREIPVTKIVYVEKADLKRFRNEEVRLMNLYSIQLRETANVSSAQVQGNQPKIQWVSEPNVKMQIIFPDGSRKWALIEPSIKHVQTGDIIQLMRIGFFCVHQVGEQTILYFTHQ